MDENLNKLFSENLKYYLSTADKTQADLSRYIRVSSATVSDWCDGYKIPLADKLQSICNWLRIEMGDLFSETRKEKSIINQMILTDPEEKEIIHRYRAADDLDRALVRRTLGMDERQKGDGQVGGSLVS